MSEKMMAREQQQSSAPRGVKWVEVNFLRALDTWSLPAGGQTLTDPFASFM